MIWLSALPALMSIRCRPAGPIAMPTIRNSATSGRRTFWASKPVIVPTANMMPPDISVCLAISIEVDDSNHLLPAELSTGAACHDPAPELHYAQRISGREDSMSVQATAFETRTESNAGKALFASAIGYAMDGFDLLILGFMLRAISAELHLTQPQARSLVTWTLVGAVVGGIVFGMLSDYYGRVRMLTWTILLFAVFT